MVEDHAAIGVIDTVIDVVAKLPAANCLPDNLGYGGGSGGDQEPSRLRQDFYRFREKTIQFTVDQLLDKITLHDLSNSREKESRQFLRRILETVPKMND